MNRSLISLRNIIIPTSHRVNSIKARLIRQSQTRLQSDLAVPVMCVALEV